MDIHKLEKGFTIRLHNKSFIIVNKTQDYLADDFGIYYTAESGGEFVGVAVPLQKNSKEIQVMHARKTGENSYAYSGHKWMEDFTLTKEYLEILETHKENTKKPEKVD